MKAKSKLRSALSTFYALITVFAVQSIAYSIFLKPVWQVMQDQGVLRSDYATSTGAMVFLLTLILGTWILIDLIKKADDNLDAVYFGFLLALAMSLPVIGQFFLYNIQWQVPLITTGANIASYCLAGLIYSATCGRSDEMSGMGGA